jgi:phosphoribosylformimino-5-aminoimidazole carboxamide ribotide isomerase
VTIELYPAVDILGGKAVRLQQGDFARTTEYDADPLDAARRWAGAGTSWLHVVDLDGARDGRPINLRHLERIKTALPLRIQYGGGLRRMEDAEAALDAGAERIVIGTAAFLDDRLLGDLVTRFDNRIAVGIDVRGGRVAIRGWRERVELTPAEAVERLVGKGVQTIVYTKVDWDGTMQGADLSAATDLVKAAQGAQVIYSGGIGSVEDLRALAGLAPPKVAGVIVGKALYEHRFTVEEARAVL